MHVADVVIAIAIAQTGLAAPPGDAEGWRHIRSHLQQALRVLDALHIIAKEELKQHQKFVIPGIVKLKVKYQRLKKVAQPRLKAMTVQAFPARALKTATLGRERTWCAIAES